MTGLICSGLIILQGGEKMFAQDIGYGTGQWDRKELGNHRAVLEVNDYSDVVLAHVPWRREDDPHDKAVIIIDASTGNRIVNVHVLAATREYGDILFQPATGKGEYYLYYMPYKTTGSWYFPNTVYLHPTENYDPDWARKADLPAAGHLSAGNKSEGAGDPGKWPRADVRRFESINDFNRFDPMETIATKKEVEELLAANQGKHFLVFPEDRKHPVRMDADIPLCWVRRKDGEPFRGEALRNEFFVYQLGLFAALRELRHVRLVFSDLEDGQGNRIAATAIRCFNLRGKDWLGKPFVKEVNIMQGRIQSLWVGMDIREQTRPGMYSGKVTVMADGEEPRPIGVQIRVDDRVIADRGYDDLFRMSRLNWLDSDIGLDDSVYKPYTPVELEGRTVKVLGRTLRFDRYGLPEKITSAFTGSNESADGPSRDILQGAVRLLAIREGKELEWKGSRPVILGKTGGAVSWETRQTRPDALLDIRAKMECDGYVNYQVVLTAKKDMTLDDIRLLIPYAKPVATYMMGLGFRSGKRPAQWDWKWDKGRANNMVWVGGVNAGLQCKLKNESPDWSLYNFDKTGPYKDWSNEGLGGCHLSEEAGSYLFQAFTGRRQLSAGQTLHLNFGLLITPLKLLNPDHWNERYFQSDPPVDNWLSQALIKGANVMNIHQGNLLNPYINYPFIATDTMRGYIAAARAKGIRSKIYYTVRELSNYTKEIWALRSLGDEIFTPGLGAQLADQFADDGAGGNLYSTGGAWLVEHLRTRYDAAWHSPLQNGDWDMAIRTQGLSRWHNYYLEGLGWLVKNVGVRGIYLDGAGYDREIMKRVRKVLDRSADSCLIDFHSGNNFQPAYGLNSTANEYMELFPCINSLWLGEMFNYDSDPDYWLVEMAGIPFGLFGEMLNGCGNVYRGMLYGMTSRLGWGNCDPSSLWKLWDAFGIRDARMVGFWDPALPVKCSRDDIKVTVYRKPGKLLIAYASWAKDNVSVRLDLDWKALKMDPGNVTIHAPSVEGLQEGQEYSGLENISVPAGKGGLIVIENK